MTERKGVILLNMGGPDSLEAVRPFLYNLFSDRDIIKLGPSFMQRLLAWYIAKKRAPKSQANYQKIGGQSRLREVTEAQATALAVRLQKEGDFYTTVAMRYWKPDTDSALAKMEENRVEEIIALTLYPHYSRATTGSSLKILQERMKVRKMQQSLRIIHSYPTQPEYIQAVADNITAAVALLRKNMEKAQKLQVVYSAHSLPVSFIKEGDPYVTQLQESIAAIEKITTITGTLCYQSRSGPVEWLAPSTPETIEKLAQSDCKAIVMVPISFVSDHIETLYEINMLYREMAEEKGMRFVMSQSLNTNPLFIEALAKLVGGKV